MFQFCPFIGINERRFVVGKKDCGEVRNKGANHDLVTYYDGKIEKILIEGIKAKYPLHKYDLFHFLIFFLTH